MRRQAAPNLLAEARLYRYPRAADGRPIGEEPIDAHNHALAALRYVIARLDAAFLARWRTGEPAAAGTGERPWLSLENDLLWHR
ncbi:MAG: hypothetical protein NZ700_10355 [Gemmataceae bacterium]|nr:hypothetical protein [Gemmataceae bacterium]MDW8265160.1 hypothetical protein [Gemmataceae bacterium]